ncbi:unnamed protein product [Sympodiomycopsis kandeliae]
MGGSDTQHPNSDDSISAYIHSTSSPPASTSNSASNSFPSRRLDEADEATRDGGGTQRNGLDGSRPPTQQIDTTQQKASRLVSIPSPAPSSLSSSAFESNGSASDGENHRRASPSTHTQTWMASAVSGGTPSELNLPLRYQDEKDLRAASGMLDLVASQDSQTHSSSSRSSTAGTSKSSTQQPAETLAHDHVPEFYIHRDDAADGNAADDRSHITSNPKGALLEESSTSLRAGARPDALLFSNPSLSQSSSDGYYQPTRSVPQQLPRESTPPQQSQPAEQIQTQTQSHSVADTTQDTQADESKDANETQDSDISGKKRRRRTKKAEADILASVYAENAFPDATMRQHLANQLGMTTRAVSIWFQNRRQAERKRATRVTSSNDATTDHLPRPATSKHSLAPRSVSASFSTSQLQRWPSLDAFASSQNTSLGRQSPCSDDDEMLEDDNSMARDLQGDTTNGGESSLNTTISDAPDMTVEDKENVPLETTAVDNVLVSDKGEHASRPVTPRKPLKDIRDLVFGFHPLPPKDPSVSAEPRSQQRGSFNRSASLNVTATSALTCGKPSMDAILANKMGGSRVPRRSTSDMLGLTALSTSQRGRASLDGKPSPPKKQQYIIKNLLQSSNLTPAMAKLIGRGDKATDSKTNESQSEHAGPEGHNGASEQAADQDDKLLDLMQTSSSHGSGDDMEAFGHHHDDAEDEEVTLRMAANRRAARAQAAGKQRFSPSNAMTDLLTRPWARSVSGPAHSGAQNKSTVGKMLPPPTLDTAAGRDRSKPNAHASIAKYNLPLARLRNASMIDLAAAAAAHSSSQSKGSNKKRKSLGDDLSSVERKKASRNSKKGRGKKGTTDSTTTISPMKDHSSAMLGEARTPSHGLDALSPTRDGYSLTNLEASTGLTPSSNAGLPSFGTPRSSIGASGGSKRSFGRSVSAQTPGHYLSDQGYMLQHPPHHQAYPYNAASRLSIPGDDEPHSPMARPLNSAFLTSTPANHQLLSDGGLHTLSLSRRASSMMAPSLPSADMGSGGREMTPRSLAFSLGLTHTGGGGGGGSGVGSGNGHGNGHGHGGMVQQTPFPGVSQGSHTTPFSGGLMASSFTSRYLSSSSRDVRNVSGYSRSAVPYSPLAKGRGARDAGMIGSGLPNGGLALGGQGNEANSRASTTTTTTTGRPGTTTNRVPFSRISSQPMVTPAKRNRSSSNQDSANKENGHDVDVEEHNSDSRFITPRRRRHSPRKSESISTRAPLTPLKQQYQAGGGDDSGFVDETTSPAAAAVKVVGKNNESPTKMEQRQNDAAEVLLGLAGEGRR